MALPNLSTTKSRRDGACDSIVLAVYAPFGTDMTLSAFPGSKPRPIEQHPLVKHLREVAELGIHVSALVDLADDDSYLIEISADACSQVDIHSAWKQQMNAPQALAGFLRRTHHRFPSSAIVLALEGHGAGYLPQIDGAAITTGSTTADGQIDWKVTRGDLQPFDANTGAPILAVAAYPELPAESPDAAALALPLSTWALGHALQRATRKDGVPRPAVIHFNNCFNMSMEVLHTVAPYADYATGYANYNFFTSGKSYPAVFKRLRDAKKPVSAEQLAKWFALENGRLLHAKKNHPTVGATIELQRMSDVRDALFKLAAELTAALKSAGGAGVRARIKAAVLDAQQFDTGQTFALEVPDQLTDLVDFAAQLKLKFANGTIHDLADKLMTAVGKVWQYGDYDRPHVDENQIWDFRNERLGINILFPNPGLDDQWDWRSPYYLKNLRETDKAPAQPHAIELLRDPSGRCAWVKFLLAYYDDGSAPKPISLVRAKKPLFPPYDKAFKPKLPHPDPKDPCGSDPQSPGQTAPTDQKGPAAGT